MTAAGRAAVVPVFLDETPGETEGADLFDPVTSPTGIWYLVHPSRGRPTPGQALLQLETAPVGGTGPDQTALFAPGYLLEVEAWALAGD